MFTDFGFQVCDKIYHLISQHFNPTFIEITCAELHEKLEVAATKSQITDKQIQFPIPYNGTIQLAAPPPLYFYR